jgi:hypothetical protein
MATTLPPRILAMLKVARTDRRAAVAELEKLSLDAQVELACETPLARRPELLELLPEPERVIARLPHAELCFTAKHVGLADAGWILSSATDEQLVACLDLDAWHHLTPDLSRLGAWIDALSEAGDETLVRAARAIDPELLVLFLKDRIEVVLKPAGDDDWQPPPGAQTVEGQFYFSARRSSDDLARTIALAMQGVIWELTSETEEWALRWRGGRLEDLGFAPWEESIAIYAPVRPEQRAQLAEAPSADPLDVEAWTLPVWMPRLPGAPDSGPLLLRAAAQLAGEERARFFFAFLALANKVAVADRLPLGEAESIPQAMDKATLLASRGLEHVAQANSLDPPAVLRRISLERLFRVGSNLERDATPSGARPDARE